MSSSYCDVKSSVCRSWHWAREDFSPVVEKLLALDEPGKMIWKTKHKECYLVSGADFGLPYDFCFKRYHEKRFLRYLFRPSLAYREFLGFKTVADLGIPTAEVLAMGEIRKNLNLKEAYFVTRFVENSADGTTWMYPDADPERRAEYIYICMEQLAHLHNSGVFHGGYHPRNQLWRLDADGKMEIIWIDLATCRKLKTRGSHTVEEDHRLFFKHFLFSAEEKQHFIDHYSKFRK